MDEQQEETNPLAALVKTLAITQRALAAELGYHPKYINRVINGHAPLNYALAGRVARQYGTEAAQPLMHALRIEIFDRHNAAGLQGR